MKNVIALTLALASTSIFAQVSEAPRYYQPEFTITNVAPICPRPAPGQVGCMAFGSKVTIQATIGCLDNIVVHEVKMIPTKHGIELHSLAVAYANPKSMVARCVRANTITKTISVPEIENSRITLINSIVENF